VALLILSTIMTVTTAAVIVTVKTTQQNTELHVNLRQVQNAGNWISRDAMMAQVVDIDKPGVFLNLKWSDWHGNSSSVDYVLTGNRLTRSLNGGTATLIAEYIIHDDTPASPSTCTWDDDANQLTVTLRACMHDDNNRYQQTYEIYPRPVASGG